MGWYLGHYARESFSAKISGNTITINMVSTDTTALYWQVLGLFARLRTVLVLESKADVCCSGASMMGSSEKVKSFTFKKRRLSFRFTAMGMAKSSDSRSKGTQWLKTN